DLGALATRAGSVAGCGSSALAWRVLAEVAGERLPEDEGEPGARGGLVVASEAAGRARGPLDQSGVVIVGGEILPVAGTARDVGIERAVVGLCGPVAARDHRPADEGDDLDAEDIVERAVGAVTVAQSDALRRKDGDILPQFAVDAELIAKRIARR